jgi:hypothetical protein
VAKKQDGGIGFDFGYNAAPKAKKARKQQTASDRQAYAIATKKGGPLHGSGGS